MRLKMTSHFSRPMMLEILLMAWPMLLQLLMNAAVQYVDQAMVGSLGTQATAAIGSTSSVDWLVSGIAVSLVVGFVPFIAKAHGGGDLELTRKLVEQVCWAVLVVGISFTLVTLAISPFVPRWMQLEPAVRPLAFRYFFLIYLPMLPRTATMFFSNVLWALGDTKTPMKIRLLVNVINVAANFFLIYPTRMSRLGFVIPGAGLGVTGAGLASLLIFTAEGLLLTLALLRRKELALRWKLPKPDKNLLLPCLRTAMPNLLQRFGTSLAGILFASMVNSLGTVATATHAIIGTINAACSCGFRNVAAPMAGRMAGSGDAQRQKQFSRTLLLMETCMTLLICVPIFVFAPQLMGFFSTDPAVIALGVVILRMLTAMEPLHHAAMILEQLQQGIGNTMTPFLYNLFGIWGIQLAGTYLCTQVLHLGLSGAWLSTLTYYLLLFVLYTLRARRKR